jgi:hypothetical protein
MRISPRIGYVPVPPPFLSAAIEGSVRMGYKTIFPEARGARGGFLFCPQCGSRTSVVKTAAYRRHTIRRLKCQGCATRFTTTETVLSAVAAVPDNSGRIREPVSAIGFVCACLDRADDPGQIVHFMGALMGAAALQKQLRGHHRVAQVAQVEEGSKDVFCPPCDPEVDGLGHSL